MQREHSIREKRKQAGSIGGSKTQASREQTPDYNCNYDSEGLEKVREFARGEGIGKGDADWFYWKGRGNGWTNGGKPILDWKATLRSWNKANYLPSQKQQKSAPQYRKGPEETSTQHTERLERITQQESAEEKAERERINEIQRQKVKVLASQFRQHMHR
jgi:hypothetical protein